MICARLKPAVSGLEREFPGKVKTHNVDATEARDAVSELGFKSHGLVIRGPDGQVLWKQADHEVRIDDVKGALREILRS